MSEPEQPPWWGVFDCPPDAPRHWRVGPLHLWVQAWPGEWQLQHCLAPDPLDDSLTVAATDVPVPANAKVQRFASARLGHAVQLGARCPDRPVVVRPEMPFTLLAGDRVELFVGTAVWLTLAPAGGEPLLELPVYRPTDTWIGADTRAGTMGYALRTSARTSLDSLVNRPGRAVTRLTLINNSRRPLAFLRVVLPMPSLSLWTGDGRLWTDAVTYELGVDDEGDVRLDRPVDGPQLSGPREIRDGKLLRRAWTALFG